MAQFRIDTATNSIVPLTLRQFGDLGFKEREHLQEWIAKQPSCLGEELLVIQKEFAGFADTNERLDLLALDKQGSLVLIENKLDDTGRDVTWQALKYASYCSRLRTDEIHKIYQEYLTKADPGWLDGSRADRRIPRPRLRWRPPQPGQHTAHYPGRRQVPEGGHLDRFLAAEFQPHDQMLCGYPVLDG